jgi:hypothetical protein
MPVGAKSATSAGKGEASGFIEQAVVKVVDW